MSTRSDSISFCELVSSGPPVLTYFLLAKLASEEQKPLAKMSVASWLPLVSSPV